MPGKFIPLDATVSRLHGFRPPSDLSFAASEIVLPLQMSELASALAWYPLCLVRQSQSWSIAALCGAAGTGNLFFDAEKGWVAPYVPRGLLYYPFALAQLNTESDGEVSARKVLCVDRSENYYVEKPDESRGEQRFFDPGSGELSEKVRAVFEALLVREGERRRMSDAIAALNEAGVLAEWQGLKSKDGEEITFPKGLYRVDEKVLLGVPDEALRRFTDTRAWGIAYAQLLSMPRLPVLARLVARQSARAADSPADLSIVSELFGDDDETISF